MPRKALAPTKKAETPKTVPTPPTKKRLSHSRAPYVPNDKDRKIVVLGSACGLTRKQLAEHVGVSEDTISKYYRDELENGRDKVTMQIASNLVGIATQSRDLKAANTAAIFWLKTRAGFSEKGPATAEVGIESLGPVRVTLKIGDREPSI